MATGYGQQVRDGSETNTVEGYFSIFKRGMKGVYQHCGEKPLHRYLAEYDLRDNTRAKLGFTDEGQSDAILANAEGKRLTYRRTAQFHGTAH